MKTSAIVFLLLLAGSFLNAHDNRFYYHAYGATFLTDFGSGPITKTTYTLDPYGLTPVKATGYYKEGWINITSAFYMARVNLFSMNDENAISLLVVPSFGYGIIKIQFDNIMKANIYYAPMAMGTFTLPAFLSYEYGAGSTNNTVADNGFALRAGVEFVKSGLLEPEPEAYHSSFIQPAFSAAYRFWTKSNYLMEINLKYGFGSASSYDSQIVSQFKKSKSSTIVLSFFRYINY